MPLSFVPNPHAIPCTLAVMFIVFIASHQPIFIFLPVDPYVDELIVSCCFFLAMTGAMVSYFGNKMYLLAIGADLNAQFKLVYKNGGQPEVVDQADVLRRASEFDINNSLYIPDHEKAVFYDNEIPPDVTAEYCMRRAALWQQFRHEMEARLLADVRNSSVHNFLEMAKNLSGGLRQSSKSSGEVRSKDESARESQKQSRVAVVEELRVSLAGRISRSPSKASSLGNLGVPSEGLPSARAYSVDEAFAGKRSSNKASESGEEYTAPEK